MEGWREGETRERKRMVEVGDGRGGAHTAFKLAAPTRRARRQRGCSCSHLRSEGQTVTGTCHGSHTRGKEQRSPGSPVRREVGARARADCARGRQRGAIAALTPDAVFCRVSRPNSAPLSPLPLPAFQRCDSCAEGRFKERPRGGAGVRMATGRVAHGGTCLAHLVGCKRPGVAGALALMPDPASRGIL